MIGNIMYRVEVGQGWTSPPDGRSSEQLVGAQWSRWSPDGSWLSYFVDDLADELHYETRELWISSADQRHTVQVAENVWDYEWSPDGSSISYIVIGEDSYSIIENDGSHSWVHGELWVWSISTGEGQRLSEGVKDWKWSPDGRYISFLVDDGDIDLNHLDGELWLWSAGLDGEGDIRSLAHNVSGWWWSPDGDIAYSVVDSEESDHTHLWISAPLGDPVAIAQGTIWDVIWSPSGYRLGFLTTDRNVAGGERDGTGSLRVIDLSGKVELQIGDSRSFERAIRDWAWSPDGSYLVYTTSGDDYINNGGELWLWSFYTREPTRIVSESYVSEINRGWWEWAPDRSILAFLVDDGDRDGSESLPDDGDLWVWLVGESVKWLSADVRGMEWSPDGVSLAYTVPDGRSDWDLWHLGREGYPLWVWSAERGVKEQLSTNVWMWDWSPDGRRIAYYKAMEGEHMDVIAKGSDFGELWVWPVGGGNSDLVTDRADRIEWEWSPSGDHLVYGNETGIFLRLRENVGFGLFWWSVWGSCYENSSGCEVVGVGEPVSDSA